MCWLFFELCAFVDILKQVNDSNKLNWTKSNVSKCCNQTNLIVTASFSQIIFLSKNLWLYFPIIRMHSNYVHQLTIVFVCLFFIFRRSELVSSCCLMETVVKRNAYTKLWLWQWQNNRPIPIEMSNICKQQIIRLFKQMQCDWIQSKNYSIFVSNCWTFGLVLILMSFYLIY